MTIDDGITWITVGWTDHEYLCYLPGLNHVILRAGMVYGPGDRLGYITSQLVIASIYRYTS